MPYVDGFVVPVPKKSVQAYRRMAQKTGKIWREHGALEFREAVADDVKVGKLTSFPRSVKLKPGETVFFSWIVYKSRADRDRVLQEGHERQEARRHDGHRAPALRRQTNDLWRVQGPGRSLSADAGEQQRAVQGGPRPHRTENAQLLPGSLEP